MRYAAVGGQARTSVTADWNPSITPIQMVTMSGCTTYCHHCPAVTFSDSAVKCAALHALPQSFGQTQHVHQLTFCKSQMKGSEASAPLKLLLIAFHSNTKFISSLSLDFLILLT